jgi:hypothetical protein
MVSSAFHALLTDSGDFAFGPPVDVEFKGFAGAHTVTPLLWSQA